jgi:predicted kinase
MNKLPNERLADHVNQMLFVVGVAGTGKSTVAEAITQKIPSVYLDRDTVAGRYTDKFLAFNGLEPDDRDSQFFLEHCRDVEYDITMDVALENLKLGKDIILVSPFTRELKNPTWIEEQLARVGRTLQDVKIKVLLVYLSDMDVQRARIISRATVRDTWKLENWDEYAKRLKDPEINWAIPAESILQFDNLGELTFEKMNKLIEFVEK